MPIEKRPGDDSEGDLSGRERGTALGRGGGAGDPRVAAGRAGRTSVSDARSRPARTRCTSPGGFTNDGSARGWSSTPVPRPELDALVDRRRVPNDSDNTGGWDWAGTEGRSMRLSSLQIQNFRCVRDLCIEQIGELNVLIGQNNSGKSTILAAIDAFFGCLRHDLVDPLPLRHQVLREAPADPRAGSAGLCHGVPGLRCADGRRRHACASARLPA